MPFKDIQKGKEWRKKYNKTYRKTGKGKQKQKECQKRWGKKHGITNNTQRLRKKVILRDGDKCKKCGTKENLTLQHKVPKIVGGKDKMVNLEILCLKCNMEHYHRLVKKALNFYFKHFPNG